MMLNVSRRRVDDLRGQHWAPLAYDGRAMAKGIKKSERAQEIEPVSLGEPIPTQILGAIEAAVHEELGAALGAAPYERSGTWGGYRNGVKRRTLTGPAGPLGLTLPRGDVAGNVYQGE